MDIVLASNGAYRLDSLNGFGTRERFDGGVLGIVTVTEDRAADLPALISAELAGRLTHFRGYQTWVAPEFEECSGLALVDVGVDGEALKLAPPLRFRSLPGALRVRVPSGAVALRGIGRSAVALVRVLAGRRPASRTAA